MWLEAWFIIGNVLMCLAVIGVLVCYVALIVRHVGAQMIVHGRATSLFKLLTAFVSKYEQDEQTKTFKRVMDGCELLAFVLALLSEILVWSAAPTDGSMFTFGGTLQLFHSKEDQWLIGIWCEILTFSGTFFFAR
jgi:hypothetical protein